MIKLLIADDSAVVRSMLHTIFKDDIRFCIVAMCENGERAVEQNALHSPDVIIMDINMPILNGIDATKKILLKTNPAVVVFTTEDSAAGAFKDAFDAGAVEVIKKPDLAKMSKDSLKDFVEQIYLIGEKRHKDLLSEELKTEESEQAVLTPQKIEPQKKHYRLLVIGSSTGGPVALQTILSQLGKDFPLPVLITQHIDEMFDGHFATWLNSTSSLPVEIAKTDTEVLNGHVYIAPASFHLTVIPAKTPGHNIRTFLSCEPPVHFLRPAVDKLFTSAAAVVKDQLISVLLTGMGRDGCEGSRAVYEKGGLTIAEDEKSCVVFGMPKAAIDDGSIEHVLPLNKIAAFLRKVTGV